MSSGIIFPQLASTSLCKRIKKYSLISYQDIILLVKFINLFWSKLYLLIFTSVFHKVLILSFSSFYFSFFFINSFHFEKRRFGCKHIFRVYEYCFSHKNEFHDYHTKTCMVVIIIFYIKIHIETVMFNVHI